VAGFIDFVLNQLPPAPCRVLEVGCGTEGGLVPALVAAGYDAWGVDPRAPEGERFVQARYQDLEPSDTVLLGIDAVVAGRVLHHVHPLAAGLDRLAEVAPLLLVDEFARDLIDAPAQAWYEEQHRLLSAAGARPPGPPSLDEWRKGHPDLHAHGPLLEALRERWAERALEWVPYLHRWLGGPASESLEAEQTRAGAFPAIGWRWAGLRRPGSSGG
jgi:SAM-dependent methyltransferase